MGSELDLSEKDFRDTVRELSIAYEEISLLYRVSGRFSGIGVSEVCGVLLDEALKVVPAAAGAVYVSEKEKRRLTPRAVTGDWISATPRFNAEDPLLKPVLDDARLLTVCDARSSDFGGVFSGGNGLIAVPLQGNARVVGLLVLAEDSGREEIYSNETKLLAALGYQAGLSIENALLLEENRKIFLGSFRALIKTLEASSCWTAGHSERVADYSRRTAEAMGMNRDFVDNLMICATLHDLGKIAVPEGILNQSNGLNSEERALVDDHPVRGAAILAEISPLAPVVKGIRHHHERWDGGGYPDGLVGEEIPLMARIIGVADAFDAMTTDRPYRRRVAHAAAMEELYCEAGTQFDPEVVSAFTAVCRGAAE